MTNVAMKRKTRIILMIIIQINILFLTGCWDYKEITDKVIVAGIAVDVDRNTDEIILTAEIILSLPTGKETTQNSQKYQGRGENIFDASRDIINKAGHDLFWSHCKIIILSEDLIAHHELFIGIMDWMKRNREIRDYIWMALSKDSTAEEILLNTNPQSEKIVSYYLEHQFLTIEDNENYIKIPFWKFMDSIRFGEGALLPTIKLIKSVNGEMPLLSGTELLQTTNLVGWLDTKQTKILLLLMDKLKKSIFTLKLEDKQMISLETSTCRTSIKPVLVGDKLLMDISTNIEGQIGEMSIMNDIFKEPDGIKKLEKEMQTLIRNDISSLLQLLQEKYKSDVINFGIKVNGKYPMLWKSLKDDWPQKFSLILSRISVKVVIFGSKQSMEITKEGD